GAQILLGFQYRAFLEPGFERLPALSQNLRVMSLGLVLVTILFLMSPATYHEIVERGHLTQAVQNFASRVMEIALLPFALSLGIDVYTMAQKFGDLTGRITGGGVTAVSLLLWYVWGYAKKGKTMRQQHQ